VRIVSKIYENLLDFHETLSPPNGTRDTKISKKKAEILCLKNKVFGFCIIISGVFIYKMKLSIK
jgi:hypothetical protein